MKDLQATRPAILAFGKDAYKILSKHLKKTAYSQVDQDYPLQPSNQ